jgi:hypothetical protein
MDNVDAMVNSEEDRVQGLSGNNITFSEEDDDVLSNGGQGSKSNDMHDKGKQQIGLVLCSAIELHKQPESKSLSDMVYMEEKCTIPKGSSEEVLKGDNGMQGPDLMGSKGVKR